jgi:hypothetical protein
LAGPCYYWGHRKHNSKYYQTEAQASSTGTHLQLQILYWSRHQWQHRHQFSPSSCLGRSSSSSGIRPSPSPGLRPGTSSRHKTSATLTLIRACSISRLAVCGCIMQKVASKSNCVERSVVSTQSMLTCNLHDWGRIWHCSIIKQDVGLHVGQPIEKYRSFQNYEGLLVEPNG